ncbi:hypothetical protein [Neobacillus sp. FSL H8-0543]|uniref:hypothetical protein n=1 Tax=Neobacillus sp. FSL H8-0543 TaxID=2954672 RepID=UPI0031584EAB
METIIFIIIAGIFSTIINKAKGNSQPKNKPFTANRFDDFRTLFENQAADPEQLEAPEKVSRGQQVLQEVNLQDIEKKYQQNKQEPLPSRVSRTDSQNRMNKPRPKIKVEEIVSGSPNKNTVINGIIWSEILGEPRSKRPYSAKKR